MVDVWALKPPSYLLLEEVDDFIACYSLIRGETHILDAFPAALLRLLALGPKSARELVDAMLVEMPDDEAALAPKILGILDQLTHLQLIDVNPE